MKKILTAIMILVTISVHAQTVQCKAQTKDNTQCRRKAVKEGYCKQHYGMITGKTTIGKPRVDLPEEWPVMSTNSNRPDVMVAWRDSTTNIIHIGYKY